MVTIVNNIDSYGCKNAAAPSRIKESDASCSYCHAHQVLKVEIMNGRSTAAEEVELSHYKVNISSLKSATMMTTQPTSAVFYPIVTMPETATVTAVDTCGQESEEREISCSMVTNNCPKGEWVYHAQQN